MPRIVKPLTDKQVSSAKPSEKAYTLPDGQGLHLLITPDGRKAWEIIYLSPTHKKRRKTSFGTFPTVSLKDARKKRDEFQNIIKQGIDPIDGKREEMPKDWFIQDYAKFLNSVKEKYEQKKLREIIGN